MKIVKKIFLSNRMIDILYQYLRALSKGTYVQVLDLKKGGTCKV